jgi:hypothetical protein
MALSIFADIAQDLQMQVDAGSLSDRAAMNRVEGDLLDICFTNSPTGRQQRVE